MAVNGAPVDIGGARAETLLALLAMRPGTPVSTDGLIDALWSGEPPDGAATTLRSYASRLRTALDGAATIERVAAGYRLAIPPESVDMTRFESGIREGYELLGRGRYRRATETLRGALGLWRGQPFSGLPDDGPLRGEIARLEELRLHALEARLDADLEVGRASELVDELEGLVAEFPFRERLWRDLMLALYRSGRQADALAAYHRARRALDEELGIEPGAELRDLEAAILRQDVPEPAARRAPIVSVPATLTSFIGRMGELGEIRGLMARARLVTLVGVGGTGKTRLALEVARGTAASIADGAAFVDLAAVTDPDLVLATVGAAIGLRDLPEQDGLTGLIDFLAGTEILLVLDNCEHVREAVAVLCERLLTASADIRILATSREVLGVPGEAAYPVPPLSLPANDGPDVLGSEAVRLFLDRATLTRLDLRLDADTYATAARICQELEGLPLAIELAAARTNALSLDEIAGRLRDRFGFLVAVRRPTAARHSTLREAMDWSYALLAPAEQLLLAQFSVFPAGATLESAAMVCLDGDAVAAERSLERLIDASLVTPTESQIATRYRLLETVRQYAAGLVPEHDLAALRRRHAERARDLAVATNLGIERTGSTMSFELAHEELPSIRAAISWAIDADPALGIEIAAALERFWATGHGREGMDILDQLLAHDDLDDTVRARALRSRGGARYTSGEFAAGTADYEAAVAIHRRLGQDAYVAHLLLRLGMEAYRLGDFAKVRRLLDQAVGLDRDERFAPDRIMELSLESDLAFENGRADEGFDLLNRAIELAIHNGDEWWLVYLELRAADRALDLGRFDDAARAGREALRLAQKQKDRPSTIWSLATLAREAVFAGREARGGRIWGGIEAERERGGPVVQWDPNEEPMRADLAAKGGDAFVLSAAEGRAMPLAAVIAEALQDS